MAQLVNHQLKTVIEQEWYIRYIGSEDTKAICEWCFAHMGFPLGILDPDTYEYNQRWHIEVPVRTSLVTHPPFVAFKDEKDLSMYLLRWGHE